MKIAKKKVRMQTFLVNWIIGLERLIEKVLNKTEYKAIKCHDTPKDSDSGSFPIVEENHLRSGFSGKTNYSRT